MATYNGNSNVAGGYYFCPRSWNVNVVPASGGALPGPSTARYVRVPFPALFVVVPVIGLTFLMFLPLIGFALLALAIVRKVAGVAAKPATELAASVSPGLATGAAYLAGKEGEKPVEQPSAEVEKLAKEIDEQRKP